VSPGEAVSWLHEAQHRGIKLGLDTMRSLVAELGLPCRAGRVPRAGDPRIFHVAGTNGKGSVCAFLDSILRSAGLSVGLYTSPHLVRFEERIRVGGETIDPEVLADRVQTVRNAVEPLGLTPTFFELATAVALVHFAADPLDAWVLETGMGGRLDATNLFEPAATLITPVDLDHQLYLGDSLEQIAAEKAGIIKPGAPVFSAPQKPGARRIIEAVASEREAPLRFIEEPYTAGPVGLFGSIQRMNAALAAAAIRATFPGVDERAIADGIASARWAGRFQRLDDRMIVDGAHNPSAASRLAETWREQFGETRATIILAVLKDKEVGRIVAALAPVARRFIATAVKADRSRFPGDLAESIRAVAEGATLMVAPDVGRALWTARHYPEPILATGSLYLVGECLELLSEQMRLHPRETALDEATGSAGFVSGPAGGD
jgi:dihydrofolate synthase/folylpolyglutamate synthase